MSTQETPAVDDKTSTVPVQAIVQSLASEEALDNFDRAFSNTRTNHCVCNCGKVYWDCHNSGYDWCEGEVERLEADPNATAVQYAIGVIDVDGRWYANACDCWKTRATRIINWLEENREAVATFLRHEKARRVAEATMMATVD